MRIKFLLQIEKEPSMKNNHFFKDYRRKFLSFYKGRFYKPSNNQNLRGSPKPQGELCRTFPKITFHGVKPLDFASLQFQKTQIMRSGSWLMYEHALKVPNDFLLAVAWDRSLH
jgi:hypothetical protein